MKVSVLLSIPSQEALVESASASIENRTSNATLNDVRTPSGFSIDTSQPPVAIGNLEDGYLELDSLSVERSEKFIVQGDIEVDSIDGIPEKIDDREVFSNIKISPFSYCGVSAQGTANDIVTRLNLSKLHQKGLDGSNVAVAIVDTGINLSYLKNKIGQVPRFDAANSWQYLGQKALPGQYPVDHGTMCAFDALIAAPNATLLDYPVLSSTAPGGNVTGRTINAAMMAYAHLTANYAAAYAPGGAQGYNGLVVNNSWGVYHPSWDFPKNHPGRFIDNPNHPFTTYVRTLTTAGADVLFAAGNCGSNCPDPRCKGRTQGTIMGANAYDDVMTVAGCLVTNNDRLGYSSQGPSVNGMPQNKPDITAFSHFLGSGAYGSTVPDSGTSAACPVAAGCVAAIRTKASPSTIPPSNLKQQFHLTAQSVAGQPAGWGPDYGYGIIDPLSTANSLGL